MKHAFFGFFLIIACLQAKAQFNTYGEVSISVGTGKYLAESAPGFHLAGTMHCMAGIQYGVVALNAGIGFNILSDKPKDLNFSGGEGGQNGDIDFPVGITLRFPLENSILAVGMDISGFIGNFVMTAGPHLDLLFAGKRAYRGIFIKAFTNIEKGSPAFTPQYLGIGFKTTFG